VLKIAVRSPWAFVPRRLRHRRIGRATPAKTRTRSVVSLALAENENLSDTRRAKAHFGAARLTAAR
jgi:hypothetical protein